MQRWLWLDQFQSTKFSAAKWVIIHTEQKAIPLDRASQFKKNDKKKCTFKLLSRWRYGLQKHTNNVKCIRDSLWGCHGWSKLFCLWVEIFFIFILPFSDRKVLSPTAITAKTLPKCQSVESVLKPSQDASHYKWTWWQFERRQKEMEWDESYLHRVVRLGSLHSPETWNPKVKPPSSSHLWKTSSKEATTGLFFGASFLYTVFQRTRGRSCSCDRVVDNKSSTCVSALITAQFWPVGPRGHGWYVNRPTLVGNSAAAAVCVYRRFLHMCLLQ